MMLAVVPPLVAALVRVVGSTWRYADVNAPGVRNGHVIPGPTVFAFWHEALLCSAHRFRNLGIAIVISRSFDGELIARVVERLGFIAVRGSSTRGGPSVLRQMQQAYVDGRICAFTADGPKGPRRVAKPGAAQLAVLTGAEWVGAFHAEASSAWRLGSWDRFVIPKPWARITFAWPAHAVPEPEAVQRALDEAVQMAEGAR
jgi:hypothetical protein